MKGKINFKAVSEDVFNYFLGDQYPGGRVVLRKPITNPFLSERQKTPSFNIFITRHGEWIYNDYKTGDKGNCVSLVAKLKSIDRIEAIKLIRKSLNYK